MTSTEQGTRYEWSQRIADYILGRITIELLIDEIVAAQQRDQVEIWAVAREYLPEAIGHNTLPEIMRGIARQRDFQHEIKDHLADVARKLTERVAESEAARANLQQVLVDHDQVRADLLARLQADRLREWQQGSDEIARLKAEVAAEQRGREAERQYRTVPNIGASSSYLPPECTCFWTDPATWTYYGSAVEPGSQMEPNPECAVHFSAARETKS